MIVGPREDRSTLVNAFALDGCDYVSDDQVVVRRAHHQAGVIAMESWHRQRAGLPPENWKPVTQLRGVILARAIVRLPTAGRMVSGITKTDAPDRVSPPIRLKFYCDRTSREYMDIQAIRDKNVLLRPEDYAGRPIVNFRNIAIGVVAYLGSLPYLQPHIISHFLHCGF